MNSLTRDEVRNIDRCAIEEIGVPGVVLMENAGRQAADVAEKLLGKIAADKSVAVVAGAGNNGGDGFVVARHLSMRGAKVATYLVAAAEGITGHAEINLRILRNLGGDIHCVSKQLDKLAELLAGFDLVVDAIGGTGIRGALRGEAATAVEQINAAGRPVLAIDIPTGLDCDTGAAIGPAVRAVATVTFVARKAGFDAEGAEAFTGEVRVADIGIPPEVVMGIARGAGAAE